MNQLSNRIGNISAFQYRRNPHVWNPRLADSCRAVCHAFVYLSIARAILIASGVIVLGVVWLTLYVVRHTSDTDEAGSCALIHAAVPAGGSVPSILPNEAISNAKARAPLSDRLKSTEMLGHFMSTLVLTVLSVYIGHRLGILPTQNFSDWLSYLGFSTRRNTKHSSQQQFAACAAAAAAGKKSWNGVRVHEARRRIGAAMTQDECAQTASEAESGGGVGGGDHLRRNTPGQTVEAKAYSYYLREEQRSQFEYQEKLRSGLRLCQGARLLRQEIPGGSNEVTSTVSRERERD
jgi:hypothetical protein